MSDTGVTDLAVQRLFDGKAAAWPSKYAPGGRLAGRLTQLRDAVTRHVPRGSRVLDLGCGTGELAVALADAGMWVVGCDISPRMLSHAAASATGTSVGASWVRLDSRWQVLPLRPSSFDAVVASSVLEYTDDPANVLGECCRVLRPGGIVLCTVPDPSHPVRWLEWLTAVTAARMPLLESMARRWPRAVGYLTYLRVSRQRHRARWWSAAATRAGLVSTLTAGHSPLLLMTLVRPGGPAQSVTGREVADHD
jgi:ubiquinone/menaquinone biosynthesis C-methylase UbiE